MSIYAKCRNLHPGLSRAVPPPGPIAPAPGGPPGVDDDDCDVRLADDGLDPDGLEPDGPDPATIPPPPPDAPAPAAGMGRPCYALAIPMGHRICRDSVTFRFDDGLDGPTALAQFERSLAAIVDAECRRAVASARATWGADPDPDRIGSHWEGCHRDPRHWRCAVATADRATDQAARLRGERDELKRMLDEARREAAEARTRHGRLAADVGTWRCVPCGADFPGPPDDGHAHVVCPACGGRTVPKAVAERDEAREEIERLKTALSDAEHACETSTRLGTAVAAENREMRGTIANLRHQIEQFQLINEHLLNRVQSRESRRSLPARLRRLAGWLRRGGVGRGDGTNQETET